MLPIIEMETGMGKVEDYPIERFRVKHRVLAHCMGVDFMQNGTSTLLQFFQVRGRS